MSYAITKFDIVFLWGASIITIMALVIAFSPWGKIRLGKKDDKPEFSRFSWIAMLFAAGMGSGLIFWGVAEPIYHLSAPLNPNQDNAMALALTYLNWGLHAWALYAIVGLSIAWFAYKLGRPMTISASFAPKETQSRFFIFDFFAVIAIIFGVAGTLANTIALVETGVQQSVDANIGGTNFRIAVLALIAIAFTLSSITGLKRGIKYLSNFNIILAMLILVVVIIFAGPWNVLVQAFNSTVVYVKELPYLSFVINESHAGWSQGWTIIYLIWWIAWTPFVGLFIAKISKGRTIREFLLSVIFYPTFASIVWFSAFGGGAFGLDNAQDIVAAVNDSYTNGLFVYFAQFPFSAVLSLTIIFLLITFVVTSADSAVYVTGLLTNNGSMLSKIGWSAILVAITLALIYQNNVDLNKIVAVGGAIPFALIIVAQLFCLIKSMGSYKGD